MIVGLKMRSVTWNRFPVQKIFWWVQTLHFVDTCYLNIVLSLGNAS